MSFFREIKEKEEAYKALQEKIKTEQDEVEQTMRREMSTELEATQQQVITLQSALEDMRRQMIEMQEQHSKLVILFNISYILLSIVEIIKYNIFFKKIFNIN